MPIYSLIEHSDNYLKTSGSLWQYHKDDPDLNIDGVIIDFPNDTDSVSFKSKQKITSQTGNDETKYVQIVLPLIN